MSSYPFLSSSIGRTTFFDAVDEFYSNRDAAYFAFVFRISRVTDGDGKRSVAARFSTSLYSLDLRRLTLPAKLKGGLKLVKGCACTDFRSYTRAILKDTTPNELYTNL